MIDIKLELAEHVCTTLGYRLFPGRCDDCGYPLLERCVGGTWFMGCFFCKDRNEMAVKRRFERHKLRLAKMGIELTPDKTPQEIIAQEPLLRGREMFGAPL